MVTTLHFIRFSILILVCVMVVPEADAQARRKVDDEEIANRIVGRDYERQINITGREIVFDGNIRYMYPDTINLSLFVQLERLSRSGNPLNAGVLLTVDAENEKVLWREKINNEYERLNPIGSILLLEAGNNTACYDRNTGKILWQHKNHFSHASEKWGIAMGYKLTSSSPRPKLQGVDVKTGEVLWENHLYTKYGWTEMNGKDDSLVFVVSDALYGLNVKSGKVWRHELFLKDLPFERGKEELMQSLVSNIYMEDDKIYVASCDRVFCLDRNGKVLWLQGVPRKIAAQSLLFTKDNLLYMVSLGYGKVGTLYPAWGQTFIASFNKETGFQNSFSAYPKELGKINYVQLRGDTLYTLFEKYMLKFPIDSIRGISPLKFIYDQEKDAMKYLVSENVFVMDEHSLYKSLYECDSTKTYVFTNQQAILCVNGDMASYVWLQLGQYWVSYMAYRGYHFLANEDETMVVNPGGELVAHLRVGKESVRIGDKLFDAQNNRIVIVDLESIIR